MYKQLFLNVATLPPSEQFWMSKLRVACDNNAPLIWKALIATWWSLFLLYGARWYLNEDNVPELLGDLPHVAAVFVQYCLNLKCLLSFLNLGFEAGYSFIYLTQYKHKLKLSSWSLYNL